MDLIDMTRPSVCSPSQSVLLCEVHGLPAVLKLYLAHPYAGNAVGEIYSIPQHSPYSLKRKYTIGYTAGKSCLCQIVKRQEGEGRLCPLFKVSLPRSWKLPLWGGSTGWDTQTMSCSPQPCRRFSWPGDRLVSHDVSDATAFRKDGRLSLMKRGIVRLLLPLLNMAGLDK
jgi:hypothetical protein